MTNVIYIRIFRDFDIIICAWQNLGWYFFFVRVLNLGVVINFHENTSVSNIPKNESQKVYTRWNDHPRTVLTSLTLYMVVSFSQMSVLLTLASFGWITSTTKLAGKQRVVLALTLTDLNKLLLTISYSQFVTHNFFANTHNYFANAHNFFANADNL